MSSYFYWFVESTGVILIDDVIDKCYLITIDKFYSILYSEVYSFELF